MREQWKWRVGQNLFLYRARTGRFDPDRATDQRHCRPNAMGKSGQITRCPPKKPAHYMTEMLQRTELAVMG
jgi:hypothetical protein